MQEVIISLGEFRKNAGILGFLKVLNLIDPDQNYYHIDGPNLVVDKEFLKNVDWTDCFFKVCIKYFYKDSGCQKSIDLLEQILALKEFDKNFIKENLKIMKGYLKSSSYTNGYGAIQDQLPDASLYDILKELNDKLSLEEIQVKAKKIKELLCEPITYETFVMKSTAYNIIRNFWDTKSFLLKQNAKKEMKGLHRQTFDEPMKLYLDCKKEKMDQFCIECGSKINGTYSDEPTFLTEVGDDYNRKRSSFWNFEVNSYVCPVCAFIYTFCPLGFQKIGKQYLFINQNDDIETLKNLNSDFSFTEITRKDWNVLFDRILSRQTQQLNDLQVIFKTDGGKYRFNLIHKQNLKVFHASRLHLEAISKINTLKIGETYFDLYQNVMEHLLSGKSLYSILYMLHYYYVKLNILSYWIAFQRVLDIQIIQTSEKKEERKLDYKKACYWAKKKGSEIDFALKKQGKTLPQGTRYQLGESLRLNNHYQFFNIVEKLCCSLELPLPSELADYIDDSKRFKDIAYSFICGLTGGMYLKEGGDRNEK